MPLYNPIAVAANVVSKTANYTASSGDVVLADTSGGSFTVTVPVTAGASVTVKKADSSSTPVVIQPVSGSIDGGAVASIVTRYASLTAVGDGTNANLI